MLNIWIEELKNKIFVKYLLAVAILFILTFLFYSKFLLFIELRTGYIPYDPILSLFNPVELTWYIFSVLYLSFLLCVFELIKRPKAFLEGIFAYTILVIFRMISMYLVPFAPPPLMIPLLDPIVQLFGNGQILKNDLFFSGHTSTMIILYLTSERKYLKIIILIFTIFIASSVLLQHVHYTIDVVAAPFFTICSFNIARFIQNKLFKSIKY